MPTLQQWFDAYAISHKNTTNKTIHWVCVPLIFFSIVALLSTLPAAFMHAFFAEALQPYIHWGTVMIIFTLIFYAKHSVSMAIGILLFSLACLVLVVALRQMPFPVWASSLIIFTLAWIGQFYGHKIEGAKPSFFQDLKFLLIGPAWLLSFIYKKLGIKY